MDRGIQRAGIGPEKSLTSGYALKATEIHVPSITGSQDASLIPGLPDDVAKFCLALVPRLDFPAMSCVSRSWKALLRSKEFHLVRMKAGTLEEWLYALTVIPGLQEMRWQVLNPDCRWKCLPPMPGPMKVGFGLVVVDGKLLVIGGLVEEDSKCVARADVLEYDSATNRWYSFLHSLFKSKSFLPFPLNAPAPFPLVKHVVMGTSMLSRMTKVAFSARNERGSRLFVIR
eukprot:c27847_g1_i2 orf=1262-1948(+)